MKFSKLTSAVVASLAIHSSAVYAEEIATVVVTANQLPQDVKTVTSSINVISRDEILQKNYRSLADAVKTLPGVTVKTTGGLGKASSIFIRGASSSDNQVLILIDGIEQTDPAGFGANIANIQLDNVARIEVLKGPQSGVWGANSSAGVINIITLKGNQSSQTTDFNIEMGSNKFRRFNTNLSASDKTFDFAVQLAKVTTDGYTAIKEFKEDNKDYEDDGFEQTDVSFKMGLNINKKSRIESMVKTLTANNEYDSSFDPNAKFNNTNEISTQQLQYLFNNDNLNARVFVQNQTIKAAYNSNFGVFKTQGLTEHVGAQVSMAYGKANKANVLIEKQLFRDELNKRDYYNTGLAINTVQQLTDQLLLNAALRQDNYDEFKNATTGRIGLKHEFNEHLFIAANLGSGYNAPNLYQLSTPNIDELKPESVISNEITLGLYNAQVTYFKSKTTDKLTGVGSFPNNYFANSKDATNTEGWEFSLLHSIDTISTDIKLDASWIQAKNSQGQLRAYIPQNEASLSVDNYFFKNFHFGIETRYTGTHYSADDKQGAQIGEYLITDVFADYQFNKNINLYVKVNNIADKDYVSSVADFPATSPTPNVVYATGGREWFVGIRAEI